MGVEWTPSPAKPQAATEPKPDKLTAYSGQDTVPGKTGGYDAQGYA